jgi:hypothetical protein
MKTAQEIIIPMQIASEIRIKKSGEIVVDNPEVELAPDRAAADAVLAYRFDPESGDHVLRLLAPLADRKHLLHHRPGD